MQYKNRISRSVFLISILTACGGESSTEGTPSNVTAPSTPASACARLTPCCAALVGVFPPRTAEDCNAKVTAGNDAQCDEMLTQMTAVQTQQGNPFAGRIPLACLPPRTAPMDPAAAAALRVPPITAHCAIASDHQCLEYRFAGESEQTFCSGSRGTWGTGACTRQNAVATCDRREKVEVYYSPEFNTDSARTRCAGGFPEGTFAAVQ